MASQKTSNTNAAPEGQVEDYVKNNPKDILLQEATERCNVEEVRRLVREGANIEAKNARGETAICIASFHGHLDLVKYLLEEGASIESKQEFGFTPLALASKFGHLNVVEYLLQKRAILETKTKKGSTPLALACQNGYFGVVRCLVENGAVVDSKTNLEYTPLFIASQYGHLEIVKYLVEHGAIVESRAHMGYTPFLIASQNGHLDVLRHLLGNGAMIGNKAGDGYTAIYTASLQGHLHVVDFLLDHDALIEGKSNSGKSALNIAATNGQLGIVDRLCKHGADLKSRDNTGFDAVENSVIHGQVKVVEYFIRQTGDDAKLNICQRMLSLASEHGQKDVIVLLVKQVQNLDLNSINGEDASPLEKAISNSHFECVKILTAYGAYLPSCKQGLVKQVSRGGSIDIYFYLLIIGLPYNTPDSKGHKAHDYFVFGDQMDFDTMAKMLLSPTRKLNMSSSSLLEFPGLGSTMTFRDDVRKNLSKAIDAKVKEILTQARKNKWVKTIFQIGSCAEESQVGFWDETDYFLKSAVLVPSEELEDIGHGYRRSNSGSGYQHQDSSKMFHAAVWQEISAEDDDMVISIPPAVSGGGTANTVVKMRWRESAQRSLVISVDLVPVYHIDDWPEEAVLRTWMMDNKELRSRGYQLVTRPPHQDTTFGKRFPEEERCKLYRVSFPLLEVEHIRNLDGRIKDAYILAKCLRNPAICKLVVQVDGILHFVDKLITSYLLKTVLLHNAERFLHQERPLIEMTYILYSQLECYLSYGFIPIFWMPKINLLEGVNLIAAHSHQVAVYMKDFVGEIYREELKREPPADANDGIGIPENCSLIDTDKLPGIELMTLPLRVNWRK